VTPTIGERKLADLVVLDIHHSSVLDLHEWRILKKDGTAALLFTTNSSGFRKKDLGTIDYLCVEFSESRKSRSTTAHEVHTVLSKIVPSRHSVVLFECLGYFMLSFAERRDQADIKVVLSNWYPIYEDLEPDLLTLLDASNFSSESTHEFFYDFAHCLARPYYTEPISFEYACYEMRPLTILDGLSTHYHDIETLRDLAESNMKSMVRSYGDDYVDTLSNETIGSPMTTEDVSLDILYMELELLKEATQELTDEDELDSMDDDHTAHLDDKVQVSNQSDDSSKLSLTTLRDRERLLRWIEQKERVG